MTEQDLNSEYEEVAPHETDQDVTQHDDNSNNAESQARDIAKERDWRNMRQRLKELENGIKIRDEFIEKMKQPVSQSQQQIAPDPDVPDEDYIPAGQVKGIARKTVQPLESKLEQMERKLAQYEQEKLVHSFRTKYSDFDDVVTPETLELLETQEPELAATIAQLNDPLKMGLQSYKFIKALNLADQLPNTRRKKEISQKLEKNAKTVQTPLAYDKRPMAQAYRSTGVDSKALYEEMMFFANQANGL